MGKLSTDEMLQYMRDHEIDNNVIDVPANDPVLLQAAHDGYVDRVNGRWIAREHAKPGEKRIVRHTYGYTSKVRG